MSPVLSSLAITHVASKGWDTEKSPAADTSGSPTLCIVQLSECTVEVATEAQSSLSKGSCARLSEPDHPSATRPCRNESKF